MKRYVGSLRYLLLLLAVPLAASTVRIYVINGAGDTVDVIDPATNKIVQVIKGIEAGHGLAFSPDGKRAYIAAEFEKFLTVIDTKTGKLIKKVPLSGHPNLPAVSTDGKRVLVCIREEPPMSGVDIVDAISLEKVKTIPMKAGMHDCYTTPDGKYAVGGSPSGKFLSVIDLATQQPVWDVAFDAGVQTMSIEAGPDGSTSRIFVQLQRLNGFAVVDFKKRQEVARITFPDEPQFNPAVTTHGAAVSPDGKTFWIDAASANAVFVYSLPELKVLGHVPLPVIKLPGRPDLGAGPQWVTFTPDGKLAYVSNPAHKMVSAIDAQTLKVLANVQVGEGPRNVSTLVMP